MGMGADDHAHPPVEEMAHGLLLARGLGVHVDHHGVGAVAQRTGRELAACPLRQGADAIVVDMHAETTSEKQALGHFLDGRASVVVGTHTHAPTADHRVLPGGTAFVSDVGMTGDYESVIGMAKDEPIGRFLRKIASSKFEPAMGPATLSGLAVETDDKNGLALRVGAVRLGGPLEQARPTFWD